MFDIVAYFSQKRTNFLILLGVLLVLAVGLIDYFTGYLISFSIFYLVPILLVTWFGKKAAGIATCILSFVVWIIADVAARWPQQPDPLPILFWNACIRLGFFLITSFILFLLKRSYERERELATRDYLTKLFNSRFFFKLAAGEIDRARRYNRVFTVSYLDIDNFKDINDNFGHKVGDSLLCLVGDTIKRSIRNVDVVARLGGDEFIIMLPETEFVNSKPVIQRIQNNLLENMRKNGYPVTFSFGAVTFLTAPATVDKMIHMVDTLMYSAKQNGKNRVEHIITKA
jgi:diguanylate cyclase (GGDEF)-like protein